MNTPRQVQAMLIAHSPHHREGEGDACQRHDSRLQHNLFRPLSLLFYPSNVSLRRRQALRAHAKCPTLPVLAGTHSVKPQHKATWTKTETEEHISPGVQIRSLVVHADDNHSEYCKKNSFADTVVNRG